MHHLSCFNLQRIFFAGILFLTFSVKPDAQTLEAGVFLGGANYQGDLASSAFNVILKQVESAGGGFVRFNWNEYFSLKLQVIQTELKADDNHSSLPALQQRNLRFYSPLLDASLRLEWQFLQQFSEYHQTFSPYLSMGGSFFTFKPQADYQGKSYELQPLRTEGQGLPSFPGRKPYSLYSGSVLGGGGVKIKINEDLVVGLDLAIQYTFTDYLDDVSKTYAEYRELAVNYGSISANIAYQVDDFFNLEQTAPLPGTTRGNVKGNDLYITAGISLSYLLINPDRSRSSGIGCPTF